MIYIYMIYMIYIYDIYIYIYDIKNKIFTFLNKLAIANFSIATFMLHHIISELIIVKMVVLLPILYGLKVWMFEKSY